MNRRIAGVGAAAIVIACGVLASAGVAPALSKAETFYAVRIQELDKSDTIKAMAGAEYSATEKELTIESRYLSKALSEVSRAWATNKEMANIRFPIASLAPRRMTVMGRYSDAAKASDKIKAYEERAKKSADAAAKNHPQTQNKASGKENSRESYFREALDLVKERLKEIMAAEMAKTAQGKAPEDAPLKIAP